MVAMTVKAIRSPALLLLLLACSEGDDGRVVPPPPPAHMASSAGNEQIGQPGTTLPLPLSVVITDDEGSPVADVEVTWSVIAGGGTVSPTSSTTNSDGVATSQFTLGPAEGLHQAQAESGQLEGSPVVFSATASTNPPPPPPPPPPPFDLTVAAGGNNVPDRFSSDLWVHGSYAYTGTWGNRDGNDGNVLNVWSLDASGAPTLVGSVTVSGIRTVSDVEVSPDGQFLILSGENGGPVGDVGGIYLYSLSDPAHPSLVGSASVDFGGVHTVTLSSIGARTYAFAAKNPSLEGTQAQNEPALLIYDVTNPSSPVRVHRRPVPPLYGIHDTFVRDGLAFVFAWDTGVIIYDVGNGMRGGSPSAPVEVSRIVTGDADVGSPSAHNGWWFHNPVTQERRYLFVGQEGPSVIGSQSRGDIHVVDVSDLANPHEVAFFHLNGAGAHNFWMDEEKQILYAAYYNGGVVALDVSGTLSGDLANRALDRLQPGGSQNTFTWGVQLANGSLYAIDMVSGLWQLKTE